MLFLVLLLFLFSGLIFSKFFYIFFHPFVGVGWAYVIDQGLPLLIALFFGLFTFLLINKKNIKKKVKQLLITHGIYIVFLLLTVFIVHYFVLNYYFFAEDITHILQAVQQNSREFPFIGTNNGYPLLPFVFSLLVFKTNSLFYNITSLLLFSFSVLSLYGFIYVLSRKKILALIVGLFFATTPSYLDMFSWQASVQGMSLVLFAALMSCTFLVYYQKSRIWIFYFLSILFFISALNMGFVRIAGIIFPLLFLTIFPFFRTRMGVFKRCLYTSLPYLVIWLEFIGIRFGMSLFSDSFKISGEKSTSFDIFSYFPPLFYYLDHLFLPADIGKSLFPWLKNELLATFVSVQNISFVYTLGLTMTIILFLGALIAIFRLRSFSGKLIILSLIFILGNLFYVPLLGSVPKDITLFDRQFINPAYNPGSRYVFISAIGFSILVGLLFSVFLNSKRKLKYIFLIFIFLLIVVDGFISFSAHKKITQNISTPDKIFMENFFSTVPRDGKKKIVLSINPSKNMIDVNVGGSDWLYGFYKRDELYYTKDKDEFESLISQNKYSKDNIYAFYTNPETNSFKNISSEIYGEIINQEEKDLPISFLSGSSSVIVSDSGIKGLNRLKRAIIESEDLNYRIFSENNLHLSLSHENLIPDILPYSDIIVGEGNKYPYSLWKIISNNYYQPAVYVKKENVPLEFVLESFDFISLSKLSLEKKQEIINILKDRDNLINKTEVFSSNKNMDDERVIDKALVDGLYASDPAPGGNDQFYLSQNDKATLDLEFPGAIVLGRILLNTPKSHAGSFSPKEIEIFSSYDGINYEKAGSMNDQIESGWSPNNGKMINILLKPFLSKFLKINLSNPGGILMLDEIVVDDYDALKYSPQQIVDYKNRAFLHLDSLDLQSSIVSVNDYNKMPLIYACAEDGDWKKQKQNFETLLPGVWKIEKIDLRQSEIILPINCDGTVLQKIIIFGPPFPVKMQVENVRIK